MASHSESLTLKQMGSRNLLHINSNTSWLKLSCDINVKLLYHWFIVLHFQKNCNRILWLNTELCTSWRGRCSLLTELPSLAPTYFRLSQVSSRTKTKLEQQYLIAFPQTKVYFDSTFTCFIHLDFLETFRAMKDETSQLSTCRQPWCMFSAVNNLESFELNWLSFLTVEQT